MALTLFMQILLAYLSSVVSPALRAVSDDFHRWFTYISPWYRLGDFAIGCCLGFLYQQRGCETASAPWLGFTALVLNVLVNLYRLLHTGESGWYEYDVLYTIPTALLIWSFAASPGKLVSSAWGQFLVKMGNLCGNAFLLHQLVIRYASGILHRLTGLLTTDHWLLLAGFTLVCYVLSFACSILWKELEERIHRKF